MLPRKRKRLFAKTDTFRQNNFDQMHAFNHSSFHNFVQKVNNINGIWCLRRLIIALRLLVQNGEMASGCISICARNFPF